MLCRRCKTPRGEFVLPCGLMNLPEGRVDTKAGSEQPDPAFCLLTAGGVTAAVTPQLDEELFFLVKVLGDMIVD